MVSSLPDARSPIKDLGWRCGMEPLTVSAAAHTPQVIELVIEETIEYEFTWRIQIRYPLRAIGPRLTPRIQSKQQTTQPKVRPIAKVRPAIRPRKQSESTENENKGETSEKVIKAFKEFLEVSPDPIFVYTCKEDKDNKSTSTQPEERKEKKENPSLQFNAYHLSGNERAHLKETSRPTTKVAPAGNVDNQLPPIKQDHIACTSHHSQHRTQERSDPCARHRDWVRKKFFQIEEERKTYNHQSYRKMECVNGEGCHTESDVIETHKETCITDCLEEFLSTLHLVHLLDYLKVLGCMCVRDLRLLEMPELEAIQLVSRRRLLHQLNSLSLHHEAPPEDCSLEAWLTWYGLTHISGFLTAIGVHSVGDLGYLNEDDLLLLKPVTRRRILACHKK